MLAGATCFGAMGAFLKYALVHVPVFEAMFFRAIVSVLILGTVVFVKGLPKLGRNRRFLIIRSVVGWSAMLCAFYALSKIPLADAAVLHHTSPLFVALFGALFLGERLSKRLFVIMAIALVGVLLVYQPGARSLSYAGLISLLSGALAALAYVTVRHLHQTDSTWVIAFHMATTTALLSLPFMVFDFVVPTYGEWLALFAAGLCGTGGQIFLTQAYAYDQAARIAPFSYAAVLWAAFFGIVIWDEVPNRFAVVGMLLIIACGVAIARLRFPAERTLPSEVTGP